MAGSRIEGIQATSFELPLNEPFAVAKGAQASAQNVLVRVTLADGTEGLGEAAPFPAITGETQESTLDAIRSVEKELIDRDVASFRSLASALGEALWRAPAARAGIEMAVFDAFAKHHRLTLMSFFGGVNAALETDMTVTAGSVEHAERMTRSFVARGFRAIKVKIGAHSPEEDVARVRSVASAARNMALLVDANGGYSLQEAQTFLREAEQLGIDIALMEQPLDRSEDEALGELARVTRVPLCADESARNAEDVLRLAKEGHVSAINIKIAKCGVVEALNMWSIARAAGLRLMIGEMVEGPLATSFHAHFASGLGGFEFIDLDTPLFVASHPFESGYVQEGPVLCLTHGRTGHGAGLSAEGNLELATYG